MSPNEAYNFLTDPGHGWLQVPIAHVCELNLNAKITPYSYVGGPYAYLEEDVDAGTFLEAFRARFDKLPAIVHHATNDDHWIRGLEAWTDEATQDQGTRGSGASRRSTS